MYKSEVLNNHFEHRELRCPCCNKELMDPTMMHMLNKARDILGVSIILTSAWRCKSHNAKVGGSATSSHMKGKAVDIKCSNDAYRWKLIDALNKAGFNRIGIAKTFVHVDMDEDKNAYRMWVY